MENVLGYHGFVIFPRSFSFLTCKVRLFVSTLPTSWDCYEFNCEITFQFVKSTLHIMLLMSPVDEEVCVYYDVCSALHTAFDKLKDVLGRRRGVKNVSFNIIIKY